jgi:hypothetical protein
MNKAVGFLFFLLLMFSTTAICHASAWEGRARQAFTLDEYDKCIAIVESEKGAADSLNRTLFLAFSNLQLYQYTKEKDYRSKYQSYLKTAESKAQISDLGKVLYFVNLKDKPEVVKSARGFTKKILDGMYKIEEVPLLLSFAESQDPQVRSLTFDAMRRIFKTKRDVVNNGGNLRSQDIKIMSDPDLIRILAKSIADSKAVGVLVLIEDPALKQVEKMSDLHAVKAQEKISRAIAQRQKKYPDSNWYSATGQVR